MSGFKSLSIEASMLLANLGNIDDYENMPRKQLESILSTPYSPKQL